MERILKLKAMQLKDTFKQTLLGSALFAGVVILLAVLVAVFSGESLADLSFQSVGNMSWAQACLALFLYLLSSLLGFFALIFAVNEGTSHFDTALRFGLGRGQYGAASLVIYASLALLTAALSPFFLTLFEGSAAEMAAALASQLTFSNLLSQYGSYVFIAVASLFFYRFNWKGLVWLFGIGFALVMAFIFITNSALAEPFLAFLDRTVFYLIRHYPLLLEFVKAAVLSAIYLAMVQRFEVR